MAAFYYIGDHAKDDETEQTEISDDNDDRIGFGEIHEYVDLGLRSGTLWATCNVGAERPEDYGCYFAWGETKRKKEYRSGNSRWLGVEGKDLQAQGVIDNVKSQKIGYSVGNLTAEYDAATANWGEEWRMPTIDEALELLSLRKEVSDLNGVRGWTIRGNNGNSLFLPFSGVRSYRDGGGSWYGENGFYWTSTASEDSRYACDMLVGHRPKRNCADNYNYFRQNGISVRPVRMSK